MSAFSDGAFSIAGFSESAFDFGTAPPVVVVETASGGFYMGFDHALARRERKKRELEEMEREQQSIEDAQAREIAELLRKQEERDAERDDLKRIQALADQYAGQGAKIGLPRSVSTAILKAHEERSRNALQQVMREIERMRDEEELSVIAALLLDD